MSGLPIEIEVVVATERVRDAVGAFSRAPTEANERRVETAIKLWRDLQAQRAASGPLAARGSPGEAASADQRAAGGAYPLWRSGARRPIGPSGGRDGRSGPAPFPYRETD